MAGVALVDSLMNVQAGTKGRLDRLADVQRAMFVLDNDIGQISTGPLEGTGDAISFSRPDATLGGVPVKVRYALAAGVIARTTEGPLAQGSQRVLGNVAALRWRYLAPGQGWIDHWPPSPDRAKAWPLAVEADILLAPGTRGVSGALRRVVALPTQPFPVRLPGTLPAVLPPLPARP